jgi:BioD-like phosphotransacetylase family protein
MGASHDSIDDIIFFLDTMKMSDVKLRGVIINKVHDPEDFQQTHAKTIKDLGLDILGIVPFQADLSCSSVAYISDRLFAKIIAGEDGLNKVVKNIFVGAMSANAALRSPKFHKGNKLIITAGDRVDMMLAALDSDTTCIILTNNILPPSNIISKATDRNIPLLLVAADTYQIAQQIDNMEPLLTPRETDKIDLLERLVKEHVEMKKLFG